MRIHCRTGVLVLKMRSYMVVIWYCMLTPIDRKHRSGSKGIRMASATRDHTDPLAKLVLPISST